MRAFFMRAQSGFVQVVATQDATAGILADYGGGEKILPADFPGCSRVFSGQGKREIDFTVAILQVAPV
jgi:hypothetical protein